MLTIYMIYVECGDIMLSRHLQLDVECDFTYVTNGILIIHVDCNLSLVAHNSHKLNFFFNDSCV